MRGLPQACKHGPFPLSTLPGVRQFLRDELQLAARIAECAASWFAGDVLTRPTSFLRVQQLHLGIKTGSIQARICEVESRYSTVRKQNAGKDLRNPGRSSLISAKGETACGAA